jgi:uncharacterized protein (DUF1778 family)
MKRRDDQITFRVAGTLRSQLEAAASADDRSLSDIIRAALIDYATKRIVECIVECGDVVEARNGQAREN